MHDVLAGPARPLELPVRAEMERRLGTDLSRVRIHTDGPAAESARAVGAEAYTVGPDVVFGPGRYASETAAGHRLLSHELVRHTAARRGDGRPRRDRGRPDG